MSQFQKMVVGGVFWSVINQVFTVVAGLATMAALTRLLSVSDFGVVAMVTLATGYLNILKDFGMGSALVQKKEVTDDEYCTVFWLKIILGALFTVILFIAADFIALFYRDDNVDDIARALSFTFLINSVGVVWSSQMVKKVDFRQIFWRNFVSLIVSGLAAVIAAARGLGPWALVVQSYSLIIVNNYLNYRRSKWLPRFVFKKDLLRAIFKFSLPLMADKSLNYWTRNVDNILVGRYLGTVELGFYSKAYSLMLLPVRQISGTISKVLFPSFSLIQGDIERVARVYLKISRTIAFISFPIMINLSLFAEAFISILYGNNWLAIVPYFKVLSFLGMFQAIGTLSGNVYMSQGKTALMLKIGVWTRAVMIIGIVTGLYYGGLMGMIYGYFATSMIAFLPELYVVGWLLRISLKTIVTNFIPYFLLAAMSGFVVTLFQNILPFGLYVEFILGSGAFALLYLLTCFAFKLKAVDDLIGLVKGILAR